MSARKVRPPKTVPVGVSPLTAGAILAAVIAGPPMWTLVQSGDMEMMTALQRWGLVAGGCAVAVLYLHRLVSGYEKNAAREARIEALLSTIDEAQDSPLVRPPGTPLPDPPLTPGP
jgi:hypothetical protein